MEKLSEDPRYVRLLTDEEIREFAHEVEIKEAKEEGIELGKSEGIRQNKIETAKKMIEENINLISKITGLPKENIEPLSKKRIV